MQFLVFQVSSQEVPPQAVGAAEEVIKVEIDKNTYLVLMSVRLWRFKCGGQKIGRWTKNK
jgi:hypothetical protein